MNTLALKGKRTSQGKNQTYMGTLLCVTTSCYSAKELGKIGFTTEDIIAISNDLGLSYSEIDYIFFDGKLQLCNTTNSACGSIPIQ